jgi:hypothetical protein
MNPHSSHSLRVVTITGPARTALPRAIAPTVGVSNKTVSIDRQVLPEVTPAPDPERINPVTGEVVESHSPVGVTGWPADEATEVVERATEVVERATVTGLDGRPTPAPHQRMIAAPATRRLPRHRPTRPRGYQKPQRHPQGSHTPGRPLSLTGVIRWWCAIAPTVGVSDRQAAYDVAGVQRLHTPRPPQPPMTSAWLRSPPAPMGDSESLRRGRSDLPQRIFAGRECCPLP